MAELTPLPVPGLTWPTPEPDRNLRAVRDAAAADTPPVPDVETPDTKDATP